jgi:hypothetical protein
LVRHGGQAEQAIRHGDCTFEHNPALLSVLYSGERPEITPHEEEPNKAKTTKGNIESTKREKMNL